MLHAHAEIQILFVMETEGPGSKIIPYIGCSKRCCFLCAKFIEAHGRYRIRGTHGKVYHQWTLPPSIRNSSVLAGCLKDIVIKVETHMNDELRNPIIVSRRALVPESSVGHTGSMKVLEKKLATYQLDSEPVGAAEEISLTPKIRSCNKGNDKDLLHSAIPMHRNHVLCYI